MPGVPWKPGMPTYCARCLSPDLEYQPDGSAFCRTCGHSTRPIDAPPLVPTTVGPPSAPASTPAPAAPAHAGAPPSSPWSPPAYPWYAVPMPPRTTFSAIFGGAFQVFVQNLAPLFLIYMILGAAQAVIGLLLLGWIESALGPILTDPTQIDLATLVNAVGVAIVGLVIILAANLVLGSVVAGGVTHFAVLRHRGLAPDVGSSMRQGLRRLPSVLGATLLQYGIAFSVAIVGFAALFLGLASLNVAAIGLGIVLLVVGVILAVILLVFLSLVVPVVMLEGRSAVESLTRSWQLTRGHRGRIFLVLFVFGLIAGAIGLGAETVVTRVNHVAVTFAIDTIVVAITGSWVVLAVAVAYDLITRPPPWAVPPPIPPGAPSPPVR